MIINVKVKRDMTRAVTKGNLTTAPLAESVIKSVIDLIKGQDINRRTKIEQSLRGFMLSADDTVSLDHTITIKIDSETGRTA